MEGGRDKRAESVQASDCCNKSKQETGRRVGVGRKEGGQGKGRVNGFGSESVKEREHAGVQRVERLQLKFRSGDFIGSYKVRGMTVGMGG